MCRKMNEKIIRMETNKAFYAIRDAISSRIWGIIVNSTKVPASIMNNIHIVKESCRENE